MTHTAEHPQQVRNNEHEIRQNNVRPVGGVGVRGAMLSPDTEKRPLSPKEKLVMMTRRAVNDRLHAVQSAEQESLSPTDRIKRAFLLQNRRLRGEKDELTGDKVLDTEELTTAELASEQLARVILFSPMAADAAKRGDNWQLSRFNDMLTDSAVSVSPSMLPQLGTILKTEIAVFNSKAARRNYDISGQIDGCLKGIDGEVAMARALKTDTDLTVILPDTKGDVEGKDISVKSGSTTVHIDVKRKSSYNDALLKMVEDGILTAEEAGWGREDGYAATTQDKDGSWKYLVDADALGKINGLEYDQAGVEKTLELIKKMIHEVEESLQ